MKLLRLAAVVLPSSPPRSISTGSLRCRGHTGEAPEDVGAIAACPGENPYCAGFRADFYSGRFVAWKYELESPRTRDFLPEVVADAGGAVRRLTREIPWCLVLRGGQIRSPKRICIIPRSVVYLLCGVEQPGSSQGP